MKRSFSNIGWPRERDGDMYAFLQACGFGGLEAAPTRLFAESPYDRLAEAEAFARMLKSDYGLSVSSLQSIWYGRGENLFAGGRAREALARHTHKAVAFAGALGCRNLVFGCPKNRNRPAGADIREALAFFADISAYALSAGTVIALEPNPPLYGTNFINDTPSAFRFAKEVDGLMVNVDVGTLLENGESLNPLADNLALVGHIHISEPNLVPIQRRTLHEELCAILKSGGYDRYVSVEMKDPGDLSVVRETAEYVRRVFG